MTPTPRRRPRYELAQPPQLTTEFGTITDRWLVPSIDSCLDPGPDAAWAEQQEEPTPNMPSDPWAGLATLRLALVDRVVFGLAASQRVPRVCRYALTHGAHRPTHSLSGASQYAARRGWQVGGEEQAFTDPHGSPAPRQRTGWNTVLRHLRAGYADGVVMVTTDVLTTDPAEFEQELLWLAEHHAFLAVVAPVAMPCEGERR